MDLYYFEKISWPAFVVAMVVLSILGTIFLTVLTYLLTKVLDKAPVFLKRLEKQPNTIQSKFEFWQQIKSIFWSILLGYGAVFAVILSQKSQIYINIGYELKDILWLILTVPVMILIADLYIYFIHRLLHSKKFNGFFWKIHGVHHRSIRVNVFSSYSLDVVESVLYTLFLAFFITLVPTHWLSFVTFMIITVIYNFYIHSGYEILPQSWIAQFPLKFLNTATLHQTHHRRHDYNFAFYTNIWDRLFGTFY